MLSPTRRRSALAFAACVGLVACSGDARDPASPKHDDSGAQLRAVAGALLDSARKGASEGAVASGDDLLLKIEADAPGFAGYYWDDSKGAVVVQLAKGANSTTARSALRLHAAKGRNDFGDGRDLGKATDQTVTYSFSELVAAKRLLARLAFYQAGAAAIDADERANRVRIDMPPGADRGKLEAVIRASGVPREIVSIATEAPLQPVASVRDRARPTIVGGMQIGMQLGSNASRCTLGYDVTTSLGETGFLTAGHCVSSPYGSGATGLAIYQNVVGSSNTVGATLLNTAWNLTSPPSCSGFALCTMADVGFVQYSSTNFLEKRVVQTKTVGTNNAGGSITVQSWWTANGSVPPTYVGQSVDKVGRTTGWTRGTVDATCMDVAVALDPYTGAIVPGISYMVICADRVSNARVGQGDSGAPVWVSNTGTGSPLQPLGILFAGGPITQFDYSDGGTGYCVAGCKFFFSNWTQISIHLVRTFNPSP